MFRVVIHKESGTKNNNISLEEISKVLCPQLVEMLRKGNYSALLFLNLLP